MEIKKKTMLVSFWLKKRRKRERSVRKTGAAGDREKVPKGQKIETDPDGETEKLRENL